MSRRNFYEIINETPLNIEAEYERMYTLFYEGSDNYCSLEDTIEYAFDRLPEYLVGRTISLEDFNKTYGFNFQSTMTYEQQRSPAESLIGFCEYVWNFCAGVLEWAIDTLEEEEHNSISHLRKMITASMDDLGQMLVKKGKLYIFVPKDPAVIAVSEIIEKDLVVSILEYHHYGLKGNLAKKKAILKLMADDIENDRPKLKSINKTIENQLFQLLNKFVRHDHSQTQYIANMNSREIEECYDDIYQMWLLAKLEIDHYAERKERVESLLDKINQ